MSCPHHPRRPARALSTRSGAFRSLGLILTGLVLWGCEDPELWADGEDGPHIIVPASNAAAITDACAPIPGTNGAEAWTPSRSDVLRHRGRALAALDSALQARGSRAASRDYLWQFAGFESEGTRWLYAHALHRDLVADVVEAFRARGRWFRTTNPSPVHARYWETNGDSFCDAGALAFAMKLPLTAAEPVTIVFSGP